MHNRPHLMDDQALHAWLLGEGVRQPNGCLLWPHASVKNGRGMTYHKGKRVLVPRLAWFLTHGVWPSAYALHTCDTPACFEVTHIVDGNQQANMQDMATKKRHPTAAKLTMAQARSIRADPRPNAHIAPDYGVSACMIGRIKRNLSWVE